MAVANVARATVTILSHRRHGHVIAPAYIARGYHPPPEHDMDRTDEHRLLEPGFRPSARRRYSVAFARGNDEIRAAQRLRWRVFAEELGARLSARDPGVDHDLFDPYCEHLVVRDDTDGEVVGTYRILSPTAARRVGGYYAENEFDLIRLRDLRGQMVEIGRSCIHPDHRSGPVIALLWAGLARYMLASGHRYLIGCASMGLADGGHGAASVFERLRARSLAPVEYRVFPRNCLPLDELETGRPVDAPPLIRGYLRAGAWICGEPAWDPDFNTADFFLFLPLARLNARHARHFFGGILRVG
jgi:putative hemolysin